MSHARALVRLTSTGLLLALAALLTACGGGDGASPTPPSTPPPAAVSTVQFVGSAPGPLVVGTTVQLQARTLDAAGAVLNGRAITWATASAAIATVSTSGLVTAVAPGETQVTATSEGRNAVVNIVVIPPPVATVEVTPPTLELEAGEIGTLGVTLRDAGGNALTGRQITWASSAESVATVDTAGVVTAVAPGEAIVTATSEGRVGGAQLVVFSATAPRIFAIEPAVLLEGETATVTGVRFDPSPGGNQVRVGGVAAQVLTASATELTLAVPQGACLPEGSQPVRITVGSEAVERGHPFRPADLLDIPAGELHILRAPADLCLQLPATGSSGEWIIGVQSVSQTPELRTPVRVTARVSGDVGAGLAPLPTPRSFASTTRASDTLRPDATAEWAAHDVRHLDHMENEARLMDELMARGIPAAMAGPSFAAVPPGTAVGDTVNIQVVFGGCGAVEPGKMVVRVISTRSIIVTDTDNPDGGYTQDELEAMGSFIDNQIFARHEAHFGAFTDVDSNGRLVVVISKRVNDIGTVLGFVRSADFFTPQSCPSSNAGEYLYLITPDPAAPATSSFNKVNSLADFPRLAAHEITHVVQLGRRLLAQLPGWPIWGVEGQAVLGEEITARGVLGIQGKENFGSERALVAQQGTGTFWFRTRFSDLFFYFGYASATERKEGAPEGCGWLGREGSPAGISGICAYNRAPYGVSWSFLRWVSDHYGDRVGGEEGFNRGILNLPTVSLETLGTLVSEDYRDLLAYWAATLYTDDRASGFEPLLTFPSWNLRDIENFYVSTVRLTPYQHAFTDFERDLTLASGSSAYLRVSGASQPGTAIRVRSSGGSPAPGTVQLWVVRVP